jgi:hypothetical protein
MDKLMDEVDQILASVPPEAPVPPSPSPSLDDLPPLPKPTATGEPGVAPWPGLSDPAPTGSDPMYATDPGTVGSIDQPTGPVPPEPIPDSGLLSTTEGLLSNLR